MNKLSLFAGIIFLCIVSATAEAFINYTDGLVHDIDWPIYDDVSVQNTTTLNLLENGYITDLTSAHNSVVNIFGGSIGEHLESQYSSHVYMYGGAINGSFWAVDDSRVDMTGGVVEDIKIDNNAEFVLSGGSIGNRLDVELGTLIIQGSNFAVDGNPVGYGVLGSVFGGWLADEPDRQLTGILDSGELIDNPFRVASIGEIVLVPEPASFLLLSSGLAMLRKKRRR